jgi:hypothetical protein
MLLVSSVAITCPWQRRLPCDIPLLIKQVKGIDLAKGVFVPPKPLFQQPTRVAPLMLIKGRR